MKIESPPKFEEPDIKKVVDVINNKKLIAFLQETDERYFYWSELKYRPNIPYENPKDAWELVKIHRSISAENLQFARHHFSYNLTSFIQRDLHNFDLKLIGGLYKDSITKEDQLDFFTNSLIEEAIASSQIEGAATTTEVAREMIKSGRNPRNESEQMIINNFRAIREIETRLDEELSLELILDIHQIMTANTSASKYSGIIRNHPIYVTDHVDGEVAYTAPDASELNELIEALIHFVNSEDSFVHPIIKASILHFMMGYIHPFGDGNGRTARALFYWFLMKKGYVLLKHISISKAILDSRTSYDKAYLKTEHDDNDLTYFILYSMKSLRVAFESLVKYRDKKRKERQKASELMYQLITKGLNKRQADLLGLLYVKPKFKINIPDYSTKHGIVRQTASKDLDELKKMGILIKHKDGKNNIYMVKDKNSITNLISE